MSTPSDQDLAAPPPRVFWAAVAVTVTATLGVVLLLLVRFGYGLGTCGEDSEFFNAAKLRRMCGTDGQGGLIYERLDHLMIALAAATIVAVAGLVARKRWTVLPYLLTVAALAILSLRVDS